MSRASPTETIGGATPTVCAEAGATAKHINDSAATAIEFRMESSFQLLEDNAAGPRGLRADIQPGFHAFGASSNRENSKPGATVQPTRVQSPLLSAACQARAGTIACGRSPSARSGPSRTRLTGPASLSAVWSESGAPACQCQTSAAS